MPRLAFTTFAASKAPFGTPDILGFEKLVPAVFREAEKAEGFIDRARALDDNDYIADAERDWGIWGRMVPPSFYDGGLDSETETRASTLSIWTSIEAVHRFAYMARLHVIALSQRRKWFRSPSWPSYAMWWIEDSHTPTWAEAARRLEQIHERGPGPSAFTFQQMFDPQGRPYVSQAIASGGAGHAPRRPGFELAFQTAEQLGPGVSVEEAILVQRSALKVPFEASRFKTRRGTSSIPETHPEAELWFVAHGEGEVHCGSQSTHVQPGSIVIFAPQETHYLVNTGESDMLIFAVYWLDQGDGSRSAR
jgi:mannose-6-phosphate isomerase-like protein (cupin superfamily)